MRVLSIMISILWCVDVSACSYRVGNAEQRYQKAEAIYMGYVVGVYHEELEEQIIKEDFAFEPKARRIYPNSDYKIRIKETLKGPQKDTITFTHKSCSSGHLEVEKRVIIYRFKKNDFAMLLDKELYEKVKSGTTNKFKNEKAASGSDASSTRSF